MTCWQKLGTVLENKVFRKVEVIMKCSNKKVLPKLLISFTKYNDFLSVSPFNYLIMTHRERNSITELTWIISNSFWMLDSRKIGHWKNETKRFKASAKHSMIIISTDTPKNLTNIWKWCSYLVYCKEIRNVQKIEKTQAKIGV